MRGARRAGKMAFDLVGEIVDVDDGGLDPGRGQPVEHVVEQRLAADGDERLRHALGERAHADAVAGRQDHGGARDSRSGRTRHQTHRRNLERIRELCAVKSTEI